jgi:ABC-2 type transport system permease protein
MTAAYAITAATIRQLLPTRRAIVVVIAEALPAGIYLLMAGAFADQTAAIERLFVMVVTLYFPLLVPIVTLILASAALGAERRDGTLSFIVLRPIPRSVIAAAKVIGAVVVAGVLNTVGALGLSIAFALETGNWQLVAPLVVGGLVATVVYAAVFVPLGFFTDRAVLAGLIYVLVFENGIVFAAQGLTALSAWRHGYAAFVGLAPRDLLAGQLANFDIQFATLPTALLRTFVVALLSIALITVVLKQNDLASE